MDGEMPGQEEEVNRPVCVHVRVRAHTNTHTPRASSHHPSETAGEERRRRRARERKEEIEPGSPGKI